MKPLEKSLRNELERTVIEARDVAEIAARAAIEQLGVGEAKPFAHLSEKEKDLRRKLRVHGRQLGDIRNSKKETQKIERLVEEIAYEHWHRMLFARFLAENNLLMYPDPDEPVAVSLEECEELALSEGAQNGWDLASRFAARMLPQIFRPDSPVFQLEVPPEYEQKLEQLLAELPQEVFHASDSLGWVYQFWQAKKKDEVNASEVKIGARELPAVTQLFTEDYMVSFLLDNSLGAWWAARRLTKEDQTVLKSEEELRQKASLPSVPLKYLRFTKDEVGRWTSAAGTFDQWPEKLAEFKALDPCCGSGHFLVAAFLMLVPMRMELEGLSAREAVDLVLEENIHGLEIDQRCVELAAFALAINAWRYPDSGGYRQLSKLNIACSGIGPQSTEQEWLNLEQESGMPNETDLRERVENGLLNLRRLFAQAPTLGSLIDPSRLRGDLLSADYETIQPYLTAMLNAESVNDEIRERAIVAAGMALAAQLMADDYSLVITNVPYLGMRKQDDLLRDFCSEYYFEAKEDLATVFCSRIVAWLKPGGTMAVVTPQNWFYQYRYRHYRRDILVQHSIQIIARLGEGGFQSSDAAGAFVALNLINLNMPDDNHVLQYLDASDEDRPEEKATALTSKMIDSVIQSSQLENPDSRLSFEKPSNEKLLNEFVITAQGIKTGDDPLWVRCLWEVFPLSSTWEFYQTSPERSEPYAAKHLIIDWHTKGVGMVRPRLGSVVVGKRGVVVSAMREISATLYSGNLHFSGATPLIPLNEEHLPAIWAYCSSPFYNQAVREIEQNIAVTTDTLAKVPFDLEHWQKVSQSEFPDGLPLPYSDDLTTWIFHGHPTECEHPLQVTIARLLGYRWPAELDEDMELANEARVLVTKCDELIRFVDKDGIVCIPPVRGEASAADRLLNILAAAYDDRWNSDILGELLKNANHYGKTLESWLRDKFFTQHCKLFQHRPFIWHIWDGLNDGFAVLVNYHKLDGKLLETLIYTYLGDWISRQKQDVANRVDGAQERLAAAENLKKQLELILEGEAPYDIFVRWKPVEEQPIGWDPDLNDGVRMNIRPFMSVHDVKKKGAGVLRDKPNIKWGKDRGKDVESAPWYHLFKGDRINDHHLTLEEKRKARERE